MTKRYPFPAFPVGWYCVAFSDELRPGEMQDKKLFGQDLLLYRTQAGEAVLMDAYCPHMGAHMGRGGWVDGDNMVCPMHAFEFDKTGRCVKNAYGTKAPPKARVRCWPLREMHGVVLTWYHPEQQAPDWEVPDIPTQGWSRMARICWPLRSHPQETSENGVDLGHLAVVHGYGTPRLVGEPVIDGPHMTACYQFTRQPGSFKWFTKALDVHFEASLHGLGYSLVHAKVPSLGMHTRHFVFATPTDGEKIELRIALSVERMADPGKLFPGAGLLPWSWIERLVVKNGFAEYANDVQQDFVIWENKVYVDPPVLALGDGPVPKYRKWCRQFYPGWTAWAEAPEEAA